MEKSIRWKLFFSLAFVCMLFSCAAVPPSAAWYEGVFVSELKEGAQSTRFTAECSLARGCKLVAAGAEAYPRQNPTIAFVNSDFANNSWRVTRKYLAEKPSGYQDASYGSLLLELKANFAEDTNIKDCVDLDAKYQQSAMLCRLSGGQVSDNQPLIVVTTMASSCGRDPVICAYFYMLAKKQ